MHPDPRARVIPGLFGWNFRSVGHETGQPLMFEVNKGRNIDRVMEIPGSFLIRYI